MKLRLMILGYARHGKDTVAEILRDSYGLKFVSSSHAAGQYVMMPYFKTQGIEYKDFIECYADRVNHRQAWYEEIARYNTPDKTRLARQIYADNEIYVGMRCDKELAAAKAANLYDYSIWVDRSKHEPPEPITSNKLSPSMANYIIDNNGTLEQLKTRTRSLYVDLVSLEYAAKGHN